jgi:hypothetical protein
MSPDGIGSSLFISTVFIATILSSLLLVGLLGGVKVRERKESRVASALFNGYRPVFSIFIIKFSASIDKLR